jgi:hypothetical protein
MLAPMGLMGSRDDGEGHLGRWLLGLGLVIGVAAAGILLLIGVVWYALGLFGLIVVILVLAIAVSWWQDRREGRGGGGYASS